MGLTKRFSHNHSQNTPAQVWNINHNMGCKPTVSVQILFGGKQLAVLPNEIEYLDDNNVRISFTQPYQGSARCA